MSAAAEPKPLIDGFGRVHRDLRISVTDRCNFRCTYCMPAEGMPWLDRRDVLTFEEIERVATVFVKRFGVRSIRLTGGEPTVRAHLPVLVGRLARLGVDLAMTTNAATLALVAHDLRAAGLDRLNVSLDSLRPERFQALTRRDGLAAVLDGIDTALAEGFSPVKVNTVVMRGVNDDEVVDLAAFGRERGVEVRFIEFMPLDATGDWRNGQVVAAAEIVEAVTTVFPADRIDAGSDPAQRWTYRDGRGSFGVIPTVTEAFCDRCDRVRLTADGKLRSCLFALDEVDVRALLGDGGSDLELASAIEACVAAKWAGHHVGRIDFIRPPRSMSQIGG